MANALYEKSYSHSIAVVDTDDAAGFGTGVVSDSKTTFFVGTATGTAAATVTLKRRLPVSATWDIYDTYTTPTTLIIDNESRFEWKAFVENGDFSGVGEIEFGFKHQ